MNHNIIASLSSPVKLPSPTCEYQCAWHGNKVLEVDQKGIVSKLSINLNTPTKATMSYFVSLFDEGDTTLYHTALHARLYNHDFGLIPGYGHWLYERIYEKKDSISRYAFAMHMQLSASHLSVVLVLGWMCY